MTTMAPEAPLTDTGLESVKLSRMAWAQEAEYVDPINVSEATMLPIGKVMEQTGLTAQAIRNAIAHPRDHDNRRAPLRPLAKPRWNVGGLPYWSQEQVSRYWRIVDILRSPDKTWAHLPRITREDAVRAQLASLAGMGNRGPRLHKTNLDRWKKWQHFPEPVARVDAGGPSPMLLYPWRRSEHLRDVLTDGLLAVFDTVDEEWLTRALGQMPVLSWMREQNQTWIDRHPDVDLDVFVTEP